MRAKALLDGKGLDYEEVRLDHDPAFRKTLHDLTGGRSVPQVLIDGEPVGGFTELWRSTSPAAWTSSSRPSRHG